MLQVKWAHAVNIRLVLEHAEEKESVRLVRLIKSPTSPLALIPYRIAAAGPEPVEEWMGAGQPAVAGSVVEAMIRVAPNYGTTD